MKRTKPPLQPTRIMPKRGKARRDSSGCTGTETGESSQTAPDTANENSEQNCPRSNEGDSSSSKSPPANEPSTSTGSRLKSGTRKKRPRKNTAENNSSSVSSPPAEVSSASVEAQNGRESPELGCSICLGAVEDRAFTDACYHTFCFECLVEWSRIRAVCPLCKKSFHSIIHSFRSYDDYELYQIPTSYVSNVVNVTSLSNPSGPFPLNLSRAGRFWNSSSVTVPSHREQMLAFRRRIYSHSGEMQLRGIWSSDGVVVPPPPQVAPAVFDCYPVMLERVRPWVLRDVAVIIGNGEVQDVAGIVLNLLQHFAVTSEEFYERLFPFLGPHTRRFLLELDAFARSPFDMTTYDARVVYTTAAEADMPVRLSAEHVEDISSGDDSDIEIVSPAMVTYSESSRSSQSGIPSNHAVPDLLRYLQAVQQNMLLSFAHRPSYTSRMESPIPGPSGLGQHLPVLTDESDSVGSHTTTRSIVDAEVRSNSPMVLSDADSDVMVVDIDRAVYSPINISSGEEERAVQEAREIRRAKKRRRKERARRERRRKIELEQTDGTTPNPVFSERNVISPTGLPPSEPDRSDHTFSDQLVERNDESIVKQQENAENPEAASVPVPKRSSSRSSSADPNEHSSAGNTLSTSQPHMHDGSEKVKKRSRSANSVASLPARSDDVRPLTCKKHVSGHKSSKQKARELVAAEQSSGELVCDSAEKSFGTSQAGTTAGTIDLPDIERSSDDCQYTSNSVEVSLVCDAKDLSSNTQPLEEVAKVNENESPVGDKTDVSVGNSVPCASEACDVPIDTVAVTNCLSALAAEAHPDAMNRPSASLDKSEPLADDAAVHESSCDLIQLHLPDADKCFENIWVDMDCAANEDSCDNERRTASADSAACNLPDLDDISGDNKSVSADDNLSSICLRKSPDLFSSNFSICNPSCTQEYIDSSSQPAASSSSHRYELHVETVDKSRKEENDGDVGLPHSSHFPTLSAATESMSSIPGNSDCVCTYSGISDGLTLSPLVVETTKDSDVFSDDCPLTGSSVTDWDQSAVSPASGGLVISLETLHSDTNVDDDDDDAVAVGTDSSDSEVEYLDTGSVGRQRCISISSSDSSDICSDSDGDDVESVSSDSDTLVLVDVDDALNTSQMCREQNEVSQTEDENHTLPDNPPCPSPVADLDSATDMRHEEEAAESLGEMNETSSGVLRSQDDGDDARFDTSSPYETADESCVTELQTNSADRSVAENTELNASSSAANPDVHEETRLLEEIESSLSEVPDEHEDMEVSSELDGSFTQRLSDAEH